VFAVKVAVSVKRIGGREGLGRRKRAGRYVRRC